jgi:hypothetical protein
MAVPLSPGITGRGPPDFCQLDGGRVRRVNPGETANRKAGWLDRVGHLKDVPKKLGDFAGKKSPERSNRYFFIGNITLYHYCWGILGNIYIYICWRWFIPNMWCWFNRWINEIVDMDSISIMIIAGIFGKPTKYVWDRVGLLRISWVSWPPTTANK